MIEFCIAFSLHIGLGSGWNEKHPCVRLTHDQWTVGAFLNSENSLSAYGSYTFENGPWFFEFGAATGYSGFAVVPMVRGGVEIAENTRIFVQPGFDITSKKGGAVAGIEFTFGGGNK